MEKVMWRVIVDRSRIRATERFQRAAVVDKVRQTWTGERASTAGREELTDAEAG